MPRNGGGRYHRQAEKDTWGEPDRSGGEVGIDVGRGQRIGVPVGADFVNTVEQVARDAHYGGYYKVFLDGKELVNPDDAPEKIEAGMQIAITSYDKVGNWRS